MQSKPTGPSPIVSAAIEALDAFGTVSERVARILLDYWARRDQLTAVEVEQVISHYRPNRAGSPALSARSGFCPEHGTWVARDGVDCPGCARYVGRHG